VVCAAEPTSIWKLNGLHQKVMDGATVEAAFLPCGGACVAPPRRTR